MERLEHLLTEYLDGELDAVAAHELAELLKHSPEHRRRFRQEMRTHVLLREVAGEMLAAADAGEKEDAANHASTHATPRPDVKLGSGLAHHVRHGEDRRPGSSSALRANRRRRRSPLARPSFWMPAALAASILLAVAGFVYVQQRKGLSSIPQANTGELIYVRTRTGGDAAVVVRADGRRESATERLTLLSGDGIETHGAEVGFQYADEITVLKADEDTTFRLAGKPGAKRVHLERGRLNANVQHRSGGETLIFETPHAQAAVLGTQLTLQVDPLNTRLDVQEGRVRFTPKANGESAIVCAGEFAETGGAHALADVKTAPPGGPDGRGPTATPAQPIQPQIAACSLIGARDGKVIPGFENLKGTVAIDLSALPTRDLNVVARTEPHRIGRVIFYVNGREGRTKELNPPYALAGNDSETGTFHAWTPSVGRTDVRAVPLDEHGRQGPAFSFTLDVTDSAR